MSSPRTAPAVADLGGQSRGPVVKTSTALGRWVILIAVCVVAAAGGTSYGFWMDPGHRLVKLEGALALASVGLAVVPVAVLLRPWERATDAGGAERWSFHALLRFTAGLLSAAAALVHFAVIKQHADEYWLYGAFFVVVALGQLAWALLIVSLPSRALYALGAFGNAAIVAFFIVTRTIGTLIGPEASQPATVGFGDIATTVFEALIVGLSVGLLSARIRLSGRPTALAGAASLLSLLLAPQTALALQSAVTSAPFITRAG